MFRERGWSRLLSNSVYVFIVTAFVPIISGGIGSFRGPTGKDVHRVSRKSVVETSLEYEARAGGRYWVVANRKEVQEKFLKISIKEDNGQSILHSFFKCMLLLIQFSTYIFMRN